MAVDPSVRRLKRPVAVWLKKEKQYEFREECPYVGRKDGIVSRQFEVGGETLEKNVVVLNLCGGIGGKSASCWRAQLVGRSC